MELVLVWLVFAVITAIAAASRGRSGFVWFIIGLFLGVFGLIAVLVMPSVKPQMQAAMPVEPAWNRLPPPAQARTPEPGSYLSAWPSEAARPATQSAGGTIKVIAASDGDFWLEVVGEAQHQDRLRDISASQPKGGQRAPVNALLICDDDNPHDPRAVRVTIKHGTVGYLSRTNARRWRQALADSGFDGRDVVVKAVLRGGDVAEDGTERLIGVWLDVAEPFTFRRE